MVGWIIQAAQMIQIERDQPRVDRVYNVAPGPAEFELHPVLVFLVVAQRDLQVGIVAGGHTNSSVFDLLLVLTLPRCGESAPSFIFHITGFCAPSRTAGSPTMRRLRASLSAAHMPANAR